jgi:hypothetical protein
MTAIHPVVTTKHALNVVNGIMLTITDVQCAMIFQQQMIRLIVDIGSCFRQPNIFVGPNQRA